MPKHAKNRHAWPTFRNSERQALKGIYGQHSVRVGANTAKDFDACGMCIALATEPLVCQKGHLFCKSCIYECLMAQKDHKKKQMKKYKESLEEAKEDKGKEEKEAKLKEIEMFEKFEAGILPSQEQAFGAKLKMDEVPKGYEAYQTAEGKVFIVDKELVKQHSVSTSSMSAEAKEQRKKYLPCYWIPSLTPDLGKKKTVNKPTGGTMCPASQHKLRVKHLTPVRFTPAKGAKTGEQKHKSQEAVSARWMCPSCHDALTNTTKMACLRKCGHVLCMTCVNSLVTKDGACIDCGQDCREKDIIPLELGGTGFSATQKVQSSKQLTPAFQG